MMVYIMLIENQKTFFNIKTDNNKTKATIVNFIVVLNSIPKTLLALFNNRSGSKKEEINGSIIPMLNISSNIEIKTNTDKNTNFLFKSLSRSEIIFRIVMEDY